MGAGGRVGGSVGRAAGSVGTSRLQGSFTDKPGITGSGGLGAGFVKEAVTSPALQ